MGRKTTIIRKKQGVKCYNSDQFYTTITSSRCLCTPNDFECASDYQVVNKECVPINKEKANPKPANCQGFYLGKSGYIKIPGNECNGGDEKDKQVQISCATQEVVSQGSSGVTGIVSGKIIGSSNNKANNAPKGTDAPTKGGKKKKGMSLADFEAFGENQINEKQDMANYKNHLDEVEKVKQEVEHTSYRHITEPVQTSKSQNIKMVLMVLMFLAILIFLREHILQVVLDIQDRLRRGSKPSYDYQNAGEPTNRFDLDATEFKSLQKEDEDDF